MKYRAAELPLTGFMWENSELLVDFDPNSAPVSDRDVLDIGLLPGQRHGRHGANFSSIHSLARLSCPAGTTRSWIRPYGTTHVRQ